MKKCLLVADKTDLHYKLSNNKLIRYGWWTKNGRKNRKYVECKSELEHSHACRQPATASHQCARESLASCMLDTTTMSVHKELRRGSRQACMSDRRAPTSLARRSTSRKPHAASGHGHVALCPLVLGLGHSPLHNL